jgi:hypothetical protein
LLYWDLQASEILATTASLVDKLFTCWQVNAVSNQFFQQSIITKDRHLLVINYRINKDRSEVLVYITYPVVEIALEIGPYPHLQCCSAGACRHTAVTSFLSWHEINI